MTRTSRRWTTLAGSVLLALSLAAPAAAAVNKTTSAGYVEHDYESSRGHFTVVSASAGLSGIISTGDPGVDRWNPAVRAGTKFSVAVNVRGVSMARANDICYGILMVRDVKRKVSITAITGYMGDEQGNRYGRTTLTAVRGERYSLGVACSQLTPSGTYSRYDTAQISPAVVVK
ncbi:hypothetical protein [Symbioplanes lichenis]|uniref:hypothetical protein n=1 Tax=Symbioplanes lichenis TaxID=1629072 RepID=UPI00273A0777|nr:hypothetical protein [Actinoplanes lichenis]